MTEQKITPITYFIDKYSNLVVFLKDTIAKKHQYSNEMQFLINKAEEKELSKLIKLEPNITAPLFAAKIAQYKKKMTIPELESFSDEIGCMKQDSEDGKNHDITVHLKEIYRQYCKMEKINEDDKIKDQLGKITIEECKIMVTLLRYMDLFLEIIQLPK